MKHTVTELGRHHHVTMFEYKSKPTSENTMLYISDLHFDNPHCNRDLLFEHFQEAVDRDAGICMFGDVFCAMQGKYDRRSSKTDIRPEHMTGEYLDTIVMDTAELFAPYAKNFVLITPGNHETAIQKNHETDITARLVQAIRTMVPESQVCMGGYGGWIVHRMQQKGKDRKDKATRALVTKYFHGAGGGGPVTKGAIQQNRMAAYVEGADIVYQGHVHESQSTTYVKERYVPQHNKVILVEQEHLRGATYKEEFGNGTRGWHVEQGRGPKPLGGWWITMSRKNDDVHFDATRAKGGLGAVR